MTQSIPKDFRVPDELARILKLKKGDRIQISMTDGDWLLLSNAQGEVLARLRPESADPGAKSLPVSGEQADIHMAD